MLPTAPRWMIFSSTYTIHAAFFLLGGASLLWLLYLFCAYPLNGRTRFPDDHVSTLAWPSQFELLPRVIFLSPIDHLFKTLQHFLKCFSSEDSLCCFISSRSKGTVLQTVASKQSTARRQEAEERLLAWWLMDSACRVESPGRVTQVAMELGPAAYSPTIGQGQGLGIALTWLGM